MHSHLLAVKVFDVFRMVPLKTIKQKQNLCFHKLRRGRDRMVVGYTTTYAISVYHHCCCEFESRSRRGVQHYVITFVSDLQQVGGFFPHTPVFSINKLTATI